MRIWSLHPKYLDAKGLVALWREALLAQAVLQGRTQGYRHHPQLHRFQEHPHPLAAIATYLEAVYQESIHRSYHFDSAKIGTKRTLTKLVLTRSQLCFEWKHLQNKLKQRSQPTQVRVEPHLEPKPHPLFRLINGAVADWEKRGHGHPKVFLGAP